MSNHTPEPWRVGRPGTVVSDTPVPGMGGSDAVEYYGGHLIGESIIEANASRIVACVNACTGMGDPTAEIAELSRQRDELLAALHDAATSLETIQLRSFGADSCLDDKHSMRAYAGSMAAVARESITAIKGVS